MVFSKRPKRERLSRVAKLYVAYKFLNALYFTYPIFYQFALQTITPVQVGIFFSFIGVVGFIAEIPTGVIADKHGRKTSGLVGVAMLGFAPLLVFFGHTFAAYLGAAVLYGMGRAFLSGALESLVYDHKSTSRTAYRKINALEISAGQTGILTSAALGGLLFSAGQGMPFIAEAIAGLVCFGLVLCMDEQRQADAPKPAMSHRKHFTESMQHLFATAHLRVTVLMGTIFSVMLGMCIQFVNEAAMIELGFSPDTRGLVIAGAGVATLGLLHFVILKKIKTDSQRIAYIILGSVAAYLLMGISGLPFFLVGYLIWCCLNATSSFIRIMIHDRIPGSHRATIMSNCKALAILVGLGSSTATGLLVQWAGTPRAAYAVFGIIAWCALLPSGIWLMAQNKKPNPILQQEE